jgi:hypothetical protein
MSDAYLGRIYGIHDKTNKVTSVSIHRDRSGREYLLGPQGGRQVIPDHNRGHGEGWKREAIKVFDLSHMQLVSSHAASDAGRKIRAELEAKAARKRQ